MIVSDEKVYNLLKQRATSHRFIRISRGEIAQRTGLSMRAVAYSLKRLLADGRIFWYKPVKKESDRFDIALYHIDPELYDP